MNSRRSDQQQDYYDEFFFVAGGGNSTTATAASFFDPSSLTTTTTQKAIVVGAEASSPPPSLDYDSSADSDYLDTLSDEDYVDFIANFLKPTPIEWVFVAAFLLLMVVGVVGNLLVVYVVARNKSMVGICKMGDIVLFFCGRINGLFGMRISS